LNLRDNFEQVKAEWCEAECSPFPLIDDNYDEAVLVEVMLVDWASRLDFASILCDSVRL
jgi:hypothetical protein